MKCFPFTLFSRVKSKKKNEAAVRLDKTGPFLLSLFALNHFYYDTFIFLPIISKIESTSMADATVLHDDSTSLSDPDEPSFTLLWCTWELWCDIPKPGSNNENWLDQVRNVGLFDSVEGYWSLFNCTLLPSQLPPNSSYYLFRKHIAPMWEHEANRRGGKWLISFNANGVSVGNATHNNNHATPSKSVLKTPAAARHSPRPDSEDGRPEEEEEELQPVDATWQKMCLAAIGELYPCPEEEICGISVSRGKKGEWRVALWTRTAEDEETQLRIAQYLRDLLAQELTLEGASLEEADRPLFGFSRETESTECVTPEKQVVATPEKTALLHANNNNNSQITYVVHRDLMLAKKMVAEGTPSKPFQPRYKA
ncbi:translation initiation factor 4E [Angomonas deanei]|uniref:Eukaryotic initiation factor 4E, putative n=1 Tax=Angomonas deanei TaxID=59799 RepID=A0A7G2CCS7_9TRYP|nr:translation initiation factor 4E [Angomonas deanei]CAD2217626.1 Eukaryotic initiation factor 4E, putative [Angomonas deanei]|eukprot:EPY27010.1 translation initiation factor 4E [Angomonas deanei]